MKKIKLDERVTPEVVDGLVKKYPQEDICIVLDNTKKQSPSNLEYIAAKYKNKIIFSILGGLNPVKRKYQDEYYQKRTYYSPIELSKIIKIFQSIERKIDISWTETEKAMYIYQELCNQMEYSEIEINGRDCSRNLCGILYHKAVCAGFGMIFKEALDRIGIYNIYQNVQHSHAWNIAYLDGAYRAFELTWDCYEKTDKGCQFTYFNFDEKFYKNRHHNLSNESEEKEYEIVPYTLQELSESFKHIQQSKIIKISLNGAKCKKINILGKMYEVITRNNSSLIRGDNVKKYIRHDGSIFYLMYVDEYKDLNRFVYFEINNDQMEGTIVYSDVKLTDLNIDYSSDIANKLISKERLKRKIDYFNGYLGFIGKNHTMYYSSNIEEGKLNIIR